MTGRNERGTKITSNSQSDTPQLEYELDGANMEIQRRKLTGDEVEAYRERARHGPCFVCQIVEGTNPYDHHIIYQDSEALAFLTMEQIMYGWSLVVPREHREHAVDDFTEGEYLKLQRLVYAVGRAITRTVPTERLYIQTLGSQQANTHVHWHIVALPPGVPYERQQMKALSHENGILVMTETEKSDLAQKIAENLDYSP